MTLLEKLEAALEAKIYTKESKRVLHGLLCECVGALERTQHEQHAPGSCHTCDALSKLESYLEKGEG